MKSALVSGAYQARSVIASAQRSVNLYSEKNEQDAPFPFTYYPRAGLTRLIPPGNSGSRCSYRASNGDFYEVVGPSVFYTNSMWSRIPLGTIGNGKTPVSMSDNGLVILLVDGTVNGYAIDMATRQFAQVSGQNGAFYGSIRVDEVDTFFVLSQPGTANMYISLSEVSFANLTGTVTPDTTAAAFDPLDIAAKSGNPDFIQACIVMHRDIWLIGTETTEPWYNTGASDFTFGEIQGVFIEHGCVAPYSIAKQDLSIFWLSQDREGQTIVLMGSPYSAKRVSTHAIEQQMQGYATVADAIGYTYQQLGHTFYVLNFPTADATWVFDASQPANPWSEWTWIDGNGAEHRHRGNNAANVYGKNVCGDWETGALYAFDTTTPYDDGNPIVFRRGFPILRSDAARVEYNRLILDMDVGEFINPDQNHILLDSLGEALLDSSNAPLTDDDWILGQIQDPPTVSLRYSDTRGKSWGNPVMGSLGGTGEFGTSILFNQLGLGRNRVFEVFWSGSGFTALNGGDVFFQPCET